MNKDDENILVVERKLVEQLGMFHGLTFDTARYISVLLDPKKKNYRFVPRGKAEHDPSLKQLIPYFIIEHAGCVWCYVRGKKSGEGRLVSKASIGIGGHMNDQDVGLFEDVYRSAALRELREEVTVPEGFRDVIVALLNDDSNDVGQVHLGVVHVLHAPSAEVAKREAAITSASFKTVEELRAMRAELETWSQICLDGIETLLGRSLVAECP